MNIKSKLIPFFAAGALVSSFAARAQTAGDSNTGSATARMRSPRHSRPG